MNFDHLKEWLIDTGKLYPLGITDDHLHFAFGFIVIFLLYYIFTPVIRWISLLHWEKVLTFLVCSFFLLFIGAFIELYQGIKETGNMELSDIASTTLGIFVFGIILAISHLITNFVKHIKQKNKKTIQQHQKNA